MPFKLGGMLRNGGQQAAPWQEEGGLRERVGTPKWQRKYAQAFGSVQRKKTEEREKLLTQKCCRILF